MAVLIVMDGAEQSFPTSADLVTVLIVVIGISPRQTLTAVPNFMVVLIIMVRVSRQDIAKALICDPIYRISISLLPFCPDYERTRSARSS